MSKQVFYRLQAAESEVILLRAALAEKSKELEVRTENYDYQRSRADRAEKDLAHERENIDEQASIFRVEVIGTLGQKIIQLASKIQGRAESAERDNQELREERDRLLKEALEARTHARGIEETIASVKEYLIVANARCGEASDRLGRI